MTPIAQSVSAALLHFVWQGLLVAFLLWIVLAILKNRSANARYLACSAALALLALLPLATAVILYRQAAPASVTLGFAASVLPAAAAAAVPRFAGSQLSWLLVLQSWALPLWSAGVMIFAVRLAFGCRQVSALRRAGQPAEAAILSLAATLRARLGLTRAVSIVITAQSEGPSVIGWLRPAILLPSATILGLTTDQLEAVLAHELAHILRHDYLVNLLQNMIETLLFYHPAVWWVSARMRHERELCCDDIAVHSCGNAICYARALTTLEKMRGAGVSLALGSTGGSLLFRIQRLMGLKPRETAPSRWPAAAALLLGAACLALNMNWAHAQEKEPARALVVQGVVQGILGSVPSTDGPGVSVDLGGAAIVERPGVEYPGSAWEHKIGGIVIAEATLAGDGSVSDARILSGPAELRKTALQSILEWRFSPAPAGTIRQISINFNWELAQTSHERQPERSVTFNGTAYSLVSPSRNEQAIKFLEEELSKAEENHASPAGKKYLEQQLESARETIAVMDMNPSKFEGRIVSRIAISGLSEARQKELGARMPVHLGDTLTHQQIESLTDMLNQFDRNLGHTLSLGENNRTEIQIFPIR